MPNSQKNVAANPNRYGRELANFCDAAGRTASAKYQARAGDKLCRGTIVEHKCLIAHRDRLTKQLHRPGPPRNDPALGHIVATLSHPKCNAIHVRLRIVRTDEE